jgi:hypothetical protein
LVHHILAPKVSGPVVLFFVKNKYKNPIAGKSAKKPIKRNIFLSANLAKKTKKNRIPMQNIKNNNIRF